MAYRGRFAPSPTGPLHQGSLIAALASWCDARSAGGAWLVRMEDVDTTRTVAGAADAIVRALEDFGFDWDGEIAWQSRRTELYAAALERLRVARDGEPAPAYRCRCSRKEIADSGLVGIEGPVYPGTCRALGLGDETPGADRARTHAQTFTFIDRVQGEISQDLETQVGDFVVRRRDGLFAYQLAVVVDDAEQGITDVVRGADLLLSTPRQIHLQHLLGYATPTYLHVPAATNAEGQKWSKQTMAAPLDAARAPEGLAAALAFLGQAPVGHDTPRAMLAQAAAQWDERLIPRIISLPHCAG